MSRDDDKHLEDHAYAMLALQLRAAQEEAPAVDVSDDDLRALYEGRLTGPERARVLGHIAHDGDVYRRWLTLVEASQTADTVFSEGNVRHDTSPLQADSVSAAVWLERLRGWFSGWMLPAGALLAAAVAFVAVNPLLPGYEKDLRALHATFGVRAAARLQGTAPLPTRGADPSSMNEPYSPATSALANGLLAGLASLGDTMTIPGLTIDRQRLRDTSTLPDADAQALFALGRLAAITYAMCQEPLPEEYHMRALKVLYPLDRRLDPGVYAELGVLEGVRASQAPDAHALCSIATQLVQRFAG